MINEKELRFYQYCRKSSESSERQAASIGDQIGALKLIADKEGLNVVEIFTEEKSAKNPGRPVFNKMLEQIEAGAADSIWCWDNDRLSRNPIESGKIAWMLQNGTIKVIKTPGRSYYPEDAGLLLSIEQGRATDYIIRLSKNVKRGFKGKIEKGWRPGATPIGYKNIGDVGNKTIAKDDDRFDIVRRMWDHYLTGQYSVRELNTIVNEQWGLRTPQRRKLGGKKLAVSHMYRILNDPFYFGKFLWKDPESGEQTLYQGAHTPMITEHEFNRAQVLLGVKGKPQPHNKEFSYTGLVRCGECDSAITAEEKNQIICSNCKCKFSTNNRNDCPKCTTAIDMMRNPTILQYVYYRCSKKKGKCSQKYLRLELFEEQLASLLEKITIDQEYVRIALDYLKDTQNVEYLDQQQIVKALQDNCKQCEDHIHRLNQEYTSAQNADYTVYTPLEFKKYKGELQDERDSIKSEIDATTKRIDGSFAMAERTFNFCALVKNKFENGDEKMKRLILSSVGSNLTLKDKILSIQLLHPFQLIMTELESQKKLSSPLELKMNEGIKGKTGTCVPVCPDWLRRQDSNLTDSVDLLDRLVRYAPNLTQKLFES